MIGERAAVRRRRATGAPINRGIDMKDLKDRTEASLEKFKNRANELREELGDARAATKVQIKAMIERLEEKHEAAGERFDELTSSTATGRQELQELHDQIVDDLKSMRKTIRRRIR